VVGRQEHPVLAGLFALVGVGLVVGMVLGFGALAATKVLGLGEGSDTADTTVRQSMYLPPPQKTKSPKGPLITLAPGAAGSETPSAKPPRKPTKTKTKAPQQPISLSAGQTAVGPMEQIDLTGVYPGGEGAVLQVQRFEGGRWADFEATIPVSDGQFSTYVFTGVTGLNRFRVIDNATGTFSNEVRVRVG
jgi:hypothetical protein